MIKEAIDKILDISKPIVQEIDGATYTIDDKGIYNQVEKNLYSVSEIEFSSLEALVAIVKNELKRKKAVAPLYINIPQFDKVVCFSEPQEDLRQDRIYYYTAVAKDIPGWPEENTLSFENAMIALRTRFTETTDTSYALKLLSDITVGAKVTYNDNGVGTTVVQKTGIDLQSNATIRPIVSLKPFRTFQEVEQPASEFHIRIKQSGITFYSSDGGMWKLQARKNIKEFLKEELQEEISQGIVILTI